MRIGRKKKRKSNEANRTKKCSLIACCDKRRKSRQIDQIVAVSLFLSLSLSLSLSLFSILYRSRPPVICIEIAARFRERSEFKTGDIGVQPNAHESHDERVDALRNSGESNGTFATLRRFCRQPRCFFCLFRPRERREA